VNGLTVYVPPAFTRQSVPALLDPEVGQKLNEAEVVLGVVGAGLTEACRQELNASVGLGKQMIVMAYSEFVQQLQPYFRNLVEIDPLNPGNAEVGILEYLKSIGGAQAGAKTALLALGTLALGLLILAPADRR
jgi:hypothetical protein